MPLGNEESDLFGLPEIGIGVAAPHLSWLLPRPWDRIQFAESRFALGRGAREGVYPLRYSTERATKPQGKTASARRVAALLAWGVVARRVM